MPDPTPLATAFAALQRDRAETWPAETLAANAAQRRALAAAFEPGVATKAGDVLPDAAFVDLAGGEIRLDDLVANGPAVLILFRFATCGADTVALPIYDHDLFAPLAAAGVPLVAISPQIPERLAAIRERHALRLTIASDPGNRFARALGLTFVPENRPAPPPPGWIGEVTGTDTWELPLTSVLIVDRDRTARFVAVSPDWLDRIEPQAVLDALAAVLNRPVAQKAAA